MRLDREQVKDGQQVASNQAALGSHLLHAALGKRYGDFSGVADHDISA
jgi:hypothetical protein